MNIKAESDSVGSWNIHCRYGRTASVRVGEAETFLIRTVRLPILNCIVRHTVATVVSRKLSDSGSGLESVAGDFLVISRSIVFWPISI